MTAAGIQNDPHRDEPIDRVGAALGEAVGAVILLHGRGASTGDILGLAQAMYDPRLAYLAPAAADHSWYPYSFMAPREQNEPWVSSALRKIETTVQLANQNGIANDQIVLCGFSQGACLTTEFAATHPARYAAMLVFTGGLIGPPEADLAHMGDLDGTPVFFGSGDPDPHVPWSRVQQSAQILAGMNASVESRRYPGRAHTVSADEIGFAKRLLGEAFPLG